MLQPAYWGGPVCLWDACNASQTGYVGFIAVIEAQNQCPVASQHQASVHTGFYRNVMQAASMIACKVPIACAVACLACAIMYHLHLPVSSPMHCVALPYGNVMEACRKLPHSPTALETLNVTPLPACSTNSPQAWAAGIVIQHGSFCMHSIWHKIGGARPKQ